MTHPKLPPADDGLALQGARVLLAEDNEVNVYLFRAMLEGHPVQIDVAPEGLTALELLDPNLARAAAACGASPALTFGRITLPAIAPALEQAVLRALAKRPEDRFQDMAAFGAALEEALGDAGGGAGGPITEPALHLALGRAHRDGGGDLLSEDRDRPSGVLRVRVDRGVHLPERDQAVLAAELGVQQSLNHLRDIGVGQGHVVLRGGGSGLGGAGSGSGDHREVAGPREVGARVPVRRLLVDP